MVKKAISRDAPSYVGHLKIDPQKDKTTEFSTNSVSSKGKFGERRAKKKTEASSKQAQLPLQPRFTKKDDGMVPLGQKGFCVLHSRTPCSCVQGIENQFCNM